MFPEDHSMAMKRKFGFNDDNSYKPFEPVKALQLISMRTI
jgi:hypothetical protein